MKKKKKPAKRPPEIVLGKDWSILVKMLGIK